MKIVCLGDSFTKGFKVRVSESWPALLEREEGLEIVNKGINGDTTAGMLARFYLDVIAEKPEKVFIIGGGNDFIMNVPQSVVSANFFAMVHQAVHHNIMPYIGLPSRIHEDLTKKYWPFVEDPAALNVRLKIHRQWIHHFASHFNIPVLDLYELPAEIGEGFYLDGLHPSKEGNELICKYILQKLRYRN